MAASGRRGIDGRHRGEVALHGHQRGRQRVSRRLRQGSPVARGEDIVANHFDRAQWLGASMLAIVAAAGAAPAMAQDIVMGEIDR